MQIEFLIIPIEIYNRMIIIYTIRFVTYARNETIHNNTQLSNKHLPSDT